MEIVFADDTKYPVEASESNDNAYYFTGCPVSSGRISFASCMAKCRTRKQGKLGEQYSDCSSLIGKKQCLAIKMRREELDAGHAIYFVSRVKLLAHNDYRTRVERQKWEHLQETGKRLRKPMEEESEDEAMEDIATFNAPEVAGFSAPQNPLIERQPGLGTYAYREYSAVECENLPAEALGKSDLEYQGTPAAGHKPVIKTQDPSNAVADTLNAAIREAIDAGDQTSPAPVPPATTTTKKPAVSMLPGESPLDYARRVSAMKGATDVK